MVNLAYATVNPLPLAVESTIQPGQLGLAKGVGAFGPRQPIGIAEVSRGANGETQGLLRMTGGVYPVD